jgi:hypothetical protein
VFWAGSPTRFRLAIAGLERLKPGFRERYDIHTYDDLVHLPEAALRRFGQVMGTIGTLLDRTAIPPDEFWDRILREKP